VYERTSSELAHTRDGLFCLHNDIDDSFLLNQSTLFVFSHLATDRHSGCAEPDASTPTPAPAVSPTAPPVQSSDSPVQATGAPTGAPTDEPTGPPVEVPITAAPVADAPDTPAPVAIPVADPTAAPAVVNVVPTMAPDGATVDTPAPTPGFSFPRFTFPPTPEPLPVIEGRVYIRMLPVIGGPRLPEPADVGFGAACEEFYQGRIEMVEGWTCFVQTYSFASTTPAERRGLRSLQGTSALDITAIIRGNPTPPESAPSDQEFLATLIDIMNTDSTQFIDLLKAAGDPESQQFYSTIESVEAFDPSDPIPTITLAPSAPTPTASSSTASPSASNSTDAPVAPVPVDTPIVTPTPPTVAPPTSNKDDNDNGGLSGGAIGGIVAGALVVAFAGVGGVYYMSKKDGPGRETAPSFLEVGNPSGDFDPPTTAYKSALVTNVEKSTKVASSAKMASSSKMESSLKKPEMATSGDSMASSKASSKISKDAASAVSASAANIKDPSGIKETEAGSSVALPSVASSDIEDASAVTGSVATDKGGDDMSYAYSLDAGNMEAQSTQAGTAAASVGGSVSGDKSESGSEMSSHAMSSLRQNMVSRTVVAPPGKLGIVIDTTLEGPVVHKVNPQSPLEGTLFPGDIIVAIDDVDTRAMSASAITALMVRTANLRRKLTVLSEDNTS